MSEIFYVGDERMRRTFFFIFDNGVDQVASLGTHCRRREPPLVSGPPLIRYALLWSQVWLIRVLALAHSWLYPPSWTREDFTPSQTKNLALYNNPVRRPGQ